MSETERARLAFVAMYGEIGQAFDEDAWLEKFGVFWSGWYGAQGNEEPLFECEAHVQWRDCWMVLPQDVPGDLEMPHRLRLKAWKVKTELRAMRVAGEAAAAELQEEVGNEP